MIIAQWYYLFNKGYYAQDTPFYAGKDSTQTSGSPTPEVNGHSPHPQQNFAYQPYYPQYYMNQFQQYNQPMYHQGFGNKSAYAGFPGQPTAPVPPTTTGAKIAPVQPAQGLSPAAGNAYPYGMGMQQHFYQNGYQEEEYKPYGQPYGFQKPDFKQVFYN
jgi:hypothetical protein